MRAAVKLTCPTPPTTAPAPYSHPLLSLHHTHRSWHCRIPITATHLVPWTVQHPAPSTVPYRPLGTLAGVCSWIHLTWPCCKESGRCSRRSGCRLAAVAARSGAGLVERLHLMSRGGPGEILSGMLQAQTCAPPPSGPLPSLPFPTFGLASAAWTLPSNRIEQKYGAFDVKRRAR